MNWLLTPHYLAELIEVIASLLCDQSQVVQFSFGVHVHQIITTFYA